MSPAKTISETLFEKFCADNGIECQEVPTEEGKRTPDYDIFPGGVRVVSEVKQIDPNDDDDQALEEAQAKGGAVVWPDADRRVRNKIDSAKKQLKNRSKGEVPALLALYDNVQPPVVDAIDIKEAMYGEETVTVVPRLAEPPRFVDAGFGGGRKFTQEHNTSISAIATIRQTSAGIRMNVYHNVFAKNPISPALLRSPAIKHYKVDPALRGELQDWEEIPNEAEES